MRIPHVFRYAQLVWTVINERFLNISTTDHSPFAVQKVQKLNFWRG